MCWPENMKGFPAPACAEVGEGPAAERSATRPPDAGALVLRAVSANDDIASIASAARAAGHGVINPTHVIERDGVVEGYASLNAIPVLTGWLAPSVTQDEGKSVVRELERQAMEQGIGGVLFPCTHDCRFLEDMRGMGYKRLSVVAMFLKRLVPAAPANGENERT